MPALPAILDVAIGMTLIFLTLSAICSSINEMIANFLKLRASFLEQGILSLLADPTLARQLIEHPLLGRPGTQPRTLPAYIPSESFALALMDLLRRRAGPAAARVARLRDEVEKIASSTLRQSLLASLSNPDASKALEDLRLSIALIQDPNVRAAIAEFFSAQEAGEVRRGILSLSDARLQQVLLAFLDEAETKVQSLEDLKMKIENWFNDGMDQVSLLYKRYVERILRVLAVIVCIIFNADALHIVNSLWQDPTLRDAIVAQAQSAANAGQPVQSASQALEQLNSFPVGWSCADYNDIVRAGWKRSIGVGVTPAAIPAQPGLCEVLAGQPISGGSFSGLNLVLKVFGLALMSVGVSLGAPFWFTVLQKLVPLRPDKK